MRTTNLVEAHSDVVREIIFFFTRKHYEDAIIMLYETGPGGPYRRLAGIGGHGILNNRTLATLDRHKFGIIKTMLQMIKNRTSPQSLGIAAMSLIEMGVTWPELDVFKKSAGIEEHRMTLPIGEGIFDRFKGDDLGEVVARLEYGSPFSALSILGSNPDEVGSMVEGPASYSSLKTFEKHKASLMKSMLTLIKEGGVEDCVMVYYAAKKMAEIGIKWPELGPVERGAWEYAKELVDLWHSRKPHSTRYDHILRRSTKHLN